MSANSRPVTGSVQRAGREQAAATIAAPSHTDVVICLLVIASPRRDRRRRVGRGARVLPPGRKAAAAPLLPLLCRPPAADAAHARRHRGHGDPAEEAEEEA